MRIGIVFRGPVRPDIESVAKNIEYTKRLFKNHEVETFLLTWKDTACDEFCLKFPKMVDSVIALPEVDVPHIRTSILPHNQGGGRKEDQENSFRMFWSSRLMAQTLKEYYKKFDFIVMSRTELRIELTNVDAWLNHGVYNIPTPERYFKFKMEKGAYFWDQFGIADPETMFKAWDYGNFERMLNIYRKHISPEHVIFEWARENGVEMKEIDDFGFYMLHPKHTKGYWDPNWESKSNGWLTEWNQFEASENFQKGLT